MRQYIVNPGDTLLRIAVRFGLAKEQLLTANPWAAHQSYLKPGQILFLPAAFRRRYIIMEGDTPDSVAHAFGFKPTALEEINPGLSLYRFTPGNTIALPPADPKYKINLQGEYGPDELLQHLQQLKKEYPFLETSEIGYSVLGKPIQAVKIGTGQRTLHVHAALHANEWMTTPCLLRFLEQYAAAWSTGTCLYGHDVSSWYRQYSLWLVPMVNPDGVELVQLGADPRHSMYDNLSSWNGDREDFRRWKANIRGVDLGDQFPAHWDEEVRRRGKSAPCPQDYPGHAPLCEPEAQALAEHTINIQPERVISLHSQGQEIYWNYRDFEPEESEGWAIRLGQAASYRPVKLSGSDAGYKDWFIQQFRKPGFTVEIGRGINPLPLDDFEDTAYETGMILAAFMSLS
ncbi:M14 family metallopeptidase [Paenibacillus lemnae]|uniref:LysM peptidoglycan-binding domain-containing protein n=1 Tax=Paenibacillus lemnae TaxID=1330551 RepID=A0A848M323_PAELE|nr:M14 family metallopeptidase [Paenibacillus lemnae]NMO95408.1 LysM peptidoglycan-binding domain-containing protein [Paenibacillus lemnae]